MEKLPADLLSQEEKNSMMWFLFFPFAILIPFLALTMIFRLLRGMNQRRLYQNERLTFRQLLPGSRQIARTDSDEEFEVYIYRLAARKKGRLTSAQIVVDSGLARSEVDRRMTTLIDNVHVRMEVKDSGIIVYEFPEFFPS